MFSSVTARDAGWAEPGAGCCEPLGRSATLRSGQASLLPPCTRHSLALVRAVNPGPCCPPLPCGPWQILPLGPSLALRPFTVT